MARSISVALIVKDESDLLAQCLSSIRAAADEICVVDTGSRDDTVDIARRFDARVSSFPWADDFSAARNVSLDRCTGDWVFILDVDERIAAEDLPRIRALADGPLDCGYRFITRNYTPVVSVSEFHPCAPDDPLARGFPGWHPSVKVRLFPNRIGARFEGKVHEIVTPSLEARGVRLLSCDVPIHHYAYLKSAARLAGKQALYLRLGLEKIAANPSDPNAYAELGNQYAEVGDFARAAAAYRDSLQRDPSNAAVLKDLGGVLYLLGRREEAKHALRLALERNPSLGDAWRNLGVVAVNELAWPLAVECFERGLALDPSWADGHRYLSLALEGEGRLAEAAASAREAVAANPDSTEAVSLYVHQMIALGRRSEARGFLATFLRPGAPQTNLRNAMAQLDPTTT